MASRLPSHKRRRLQRAVLSRASQSGGELRTRLLCFIIGIVRIAARTATNWPATNESNTYLFARQQQVAWLEKRTSAIILQLAAHELPPVRDDGRPMIQNEKKRLTDGRSDGSEELASRLASHIGLVARTRQPCFGSSSNVRITSTDKMQISIVTFPS